MGKAFTWPLDIGGITTYQSENIYPAFRHLSKVMNHPPTTIIELGTANGGFTKFLHDHPFFGQAKIYTFDITRKGMQKPSFKEGYTNEDIFNKLEVDSTVQNIWDDDVRIRIENLIRNAGTCMVFCDGGNKIKEFNYFSMFLKKRDHILAHDYAYNSKIFNEKIRGKIWNWHEIGFPKVEKAVEENNLFFYEQAVMDTAVWLSMRKM